LILPNTFLANEYSLELRNFIIKNFGIAEIYNAGSVFEDASVETVIISLVKNRSYNKTKIINGGKNYFIDLLENVEFTDDKKFLILITSEISSIIKKLNQNNKLKEYAKTWRGLTTGNDKKYISNSSNDIAYKPLITGSDINRYGTLINKKFVLYIPEELDRARDERIFLLNKKLISKFVGDKLCFTIDTNQFYVLNSACVTEILSDNINIKYLLGLLNSKLLNFYFSYVFTDYRDSFPLMKSGNIESLPIAIANITDQNKIIKLVSEILDGKMNSNSIDTTAIEAEIDKLVYQLYDLTTEEIEIIENGVK
jgi:adenine-specific DNA-methyltransferase